ncbi:helix-turn-helix domain-containing protein [Acinetobacter larvae]|uniref:XRE family transcriptional regulator n=1 Tax=Acinetobacter larvae TaxID=1789224 RepID=A0A1B2M1I9_9GAMM|nr:XRE family transcriptional regulator [Acinetobacter larvae]AOA59058.1 XRE family transcriptional regulator [Acinetobacter larvae]
MTDQAFKSAISQRLKAIRLQRQLSLDETAKLTGVSKAMLGQIERQESSPSISKLWQIAKGLNVSFSSFFSSSLILKSSQDRFQQDPNIELSILFPYSSDSGIEVFELSLTGFHEQHSVAHAVGIIEYVLVLEGVLELFYDDQWHILKAGQGTRFSADQKHIYKAQTDRVRFQNIIYYPPIVQLSQNRET